MRAIANIFNERGVVESRHDQCALDGTAPTGALADAGVAPNPLSPDQIKMFKCALYTVWRLGLCVGAMSGVAMGMILASVAVHKGWISP